MDDLTEKIKDVAARLTGNDSPEGRRPEQAGDYDDRDFRDRDRDLGAERDTNPTAGTAPGRGSEPYPPVAPDMAGPEPGPYSGTPARGDGIDDDESSAPV